MKKPVLIELDDATPAPVQAAPPVPDLSAPMPEGRAMQAVAQAAARRPSALARWFWRLAMALLGLTLSLWAWDYAAGLIARNSLLGWVWLGLLGGFLLVLLGIGFREWIAFARMRRIDRLQQAVEAAHGAGDLAGAKAVVAQLDRLYAGRPDAAWGRERLAEQRGDVFDGAALLSLAERELVAPLDAQARREVEAAARQVATVTAIVPLALADVITAAVANMRMIRRIAEIYGGRTGALGSWRLLRAVMGHLVATGAVAVGDDLISSVAGGGVLSKVSRRFGEGVVNGALTARVGVAAMELCRPMAFRAEKRPRVSGLVQRALTGLFSGKEKGAGEPPAQ